jgi:trehalose 6-phosphate phosphatase
MLTLPPPPLTPTTQLPSVEHAALLLDLDGTLLDLAATPESVQVPPSLVDSLLIWRSRLGGALAIITGRPIEQIDALLPDVPTAVAGEHGGAIRHRPDGPIERAFLPSLPPTWLATAQALADAHPGARLEAKPRGFALHYRAAPQHGPALGAALAALIAPHTNDFALLPAHMAYEIRPRGADKGTAVARLMHRPPFAGRLPVFIGDDITDEDAIAEANRRHGAGLRVAEAFGTPQAVRQWLA